MAPRHRHHDDEVLRLVTDACAQVLGGPVRYGGGDAADDGTRAAAFDPRRAFRDAGLTSMGAVELRNRLATAPGSPLRVLASITPRPWPGRTSGGPADRRPEPSAARPRDRATVDGPGDDRW
ncbi:acyl carrier protein [Streptomyces chrestomyceticus]|uniref:acyl carrier protein n=1 Tax=Streptomyces chrestomyceticus TaxID=68185 RepID=UPI001C3FC7CA